MTCSTPPKKNEAMISRVSNASGAPDEKRAEENKRAHKALEWRNNNHSAGKKARVLSLDAERPSFERPLKCQPQPTIPHLCRRVRSSSSDRSRSDILRPVRAYLD
jgi:hypothetical protein